MRTLLLKHGAEETAEDKSRWDLRQRADAAEKIRLNNDKSIINVRDYYSWVDVNGDWAKTLLRAHIIACDDHNTCVAEPASSQ